MRQTAAYNLEDFAAREERTRKRLEVAPVASRRKLLTKSNMRYLQLVALAAVLVALVISVINSQINVTELTAQISRQQSALSDMQNEYTYLSNQMETKMSLKNVESYATQNLGLVKLDQSQITYVERQQTELIVLPQSEMQKMWSSFSTGVLSFMEYLAP